MLLEHLEVTGLDRELVNEEGVQDQPPDRHQPESNAIACSGESEFRRHSEHEHRRHQGNPQRDERRDVSTDMPESEKSEQDDDRERRDDCR